MVPAVPSDTKLAANGLFQMMKELITMNKVDNQTISGVLHWIILYEAHPQMFSCKRLAQ